jgi:hypothetical protein
MVPLPVDPEVEVNKGTHFSKLIFNTKECATEKKV